MHAVDVFVFPKHDSCCKYFTSPSSTFVRIGGSLQYSTFILVEYIRVS